MASIGHCMYATQNAVRFPTQKSMKLVRRFPAPSYSMGAAVGALAWYAGAKALVDKNFVGTWHSFSKLQIVFVDLLSKTDQCTHFI